MSETSPTFLRGKEGLKYGASRLAPTPPTWRIFLPTVWRLEQKGKKNPFPPLSLLFLAKQEGPSLILFLPLFLLLSFVLVVAPEKWRKRAAKKGGGVGRERGGKRNMNRKILVRY